MGKNVSYFLVIAVAAILVVIAIARPSYISDHNVFLKDFIGANLLNVLGVILAITLASAAQLHLEFNKAEERFKKRGLQASRDEVRGAAIGLIFLFAISIVLMIAKAIVSGSEEAQAWFNGLQIFVLFMNIMLLLDLVNAAFSIKPHIEE